MTQNSSHVRIKRAFSVIPHSADEVELRCGIWNPVSHVLSDDSGSGKLSALVLRLDGTSGVADLARDLKMSRSEVEALLDQLLAIGAIETGAETALDRYLDRVVPSLYGRPSEYRETVVLGTSALAHETAALLRQSPNGASVAMAEETAWNTLRDRSAWIDDALEVAARLPLFEAWRGKLIVAVQDPVDPLVLRNLNRVMLDICTPWIHGAIDGPVLLIGPTFVPGDTACFDCYEHRIVMNLRDSASYQRYKVALGRAATPHIAFEAEGVLRAMAASLVAFEAMNFVATETTFTVGKTLSVYLPTFEFAFHEVLKVPACPSCGALGSRDDEELYFEIKSLLARPS